MSLFIDNFVNPQSFKIHIIHNFHLLTLDLSLIVVDIDPAPDKTTLTQVKLLKMRNIDKAEDDTFDKTGPIVKTDDERAVGVKIKVGTDDVHHDSTHGDLIIWNQR